MSAARPRTFAAVVALAGALGCATPAPPLAAVEPIPIDLEPRCLELDAPKLAMPRSGDEPRRSGALVAWKTPGGIPGWTVATPTAGLDSLAWGFRAPDPDPSALGLAAALLRTGDTAADPQAFRAGVQALGGGAAVHVEEGWLWLQLQYLPEKRDEAALRLAEWAQTRPVPPERFAPARSSAALAQLADEASATWAAERAFERLMQTPAGAVSVPRDRASGEWDPARMDAFLKRLLQPDGSVLLHSSAGRKDAAEWPAGAFDPPTRADAGTQTPRPSAQTGLEPLPPEPGALHLVDRPGSPQVELLVGFPSVGPADPESPALEMLASLLGGNVGGRIFRDLRERQGLAYILNAFQEPEGRFVVTTRARYGRVAALLVGIEAHLRALVEVPLLDCEVRDLSRRMAGEEALLADDPEALRARLRAELARRGQPRSSAQRAAAYAAVDGRALEESARRHLQGPAIAVLVGDVAILRPLLRAALPARPLRVFDEDLERAE